MSKTKLRTLVIFGGSGSVGKAFTEHYLSLDIAKNSPCQIILADLQTPSTENYQQLLTKGLKNGQVVYIKLDVRSHADYSELPQHCDLIANFAAIHREPGHAAREYFETNINGASLVCNYADTAKCSRLLFTSSISPYGPSEEPITEESLTCPATPYGSSKLIAEHIHKTWCAKSPNKKLIIVRPGVLFGAGEGGNVGRMIQAIQRGFFFFCGNHDVIKAGGYIKELVNTMTWALEKIEKQSDSIFLYNFTMNPPATFQNFAQAIQETLKNKKTIRNIPYPAMQLAGIMLSFIFKPLGMANAFSPARLKKLIQPNHVLPNTLIKHGYDFKYSLKEALDDWHQIAPNDWVTKSFKEIERESNFIDTLNTS